MITQSKNNYLIVSNRHGETEILCWLDQLRTGDTMIIETSKQGWWNYEEMCREKHLNPMNRNNIVAHFRKHM